MTVIYIQNRSPHRILENITPGEAFTGKKSSVDRLLIFGSPAYIHIPKEKRKKLDSTSIKGIFVGYNLSSKAYKIYIKEGRHIEVSRDIIFDENHAYKRSKDIPIAFEDKDIPIFEEEEIKHDNPSTNQEEKEGPSEPIQPVIIPNTRKRPNWLKVTLEDAEGHGATKGTISSATIFSD